MDRPQIRNLSPSQYGGGDGVGVADLAVAAEEERLLEEHLILTINRDMFEKMTTLFFIIITKE